MRDLLFLLVLTIGAASVVTGVALWNVPSAFILAGVLIAGIGWLGTLVGESTDVEVAE